MYACLAVFLAYCIDRVVGDPPRMPHPIIYIGRYIAWLEKILQRPDKTPRKQFWLGTFLAVVVVVSAFAATYLLLWLLSLIHPVLALSLIHI